MNSKIKNILNFLFGLILLGLLLWSAVWILMKLASWYDKSSDALQVGIVTAVPIVIVAVIGYFANKALETKRSVEQAMRPKKLELYDEFITFLMRVFGNKNVVKTPADEEMLEFFSRMTPRLMTFASNAVIEKWGKLRVRLANGAVDPQNMFVVEDLLKEIRLDLGHSKHGFHKGDVLRLFVNDIDDYIKK